MSSEEIASTAGADDSSDPVEYFLQDITYHGKTDRTRDAYGRVLRDFEVFVTEERDVSLAEVGQRDCMAWVHQLRGEKATSTIASYASYLHRFYSYMTQVGVFESNPMAIVMEEMDESIDTDPSRREISVGEMREFVQSVRHPLHRALIVTLLKSGMRVGELCNLDLRDIHLDGGVVSDAFGVAPRGEVSGRANSMFIPSDISIGDEYNGERRSASNKRKRDTVIPVDDELAEVVTAYLLIRPSVSSSAEPLFVSTGSSWGERVTPGMVREIVAEHASRRGWYQTGGGAGENVTPHYFRHFFTTHMRDRTGERGIVKYLRGDVADDIIDTYTHNWGGRVREVYEANIYRFR